MNARSSRAAMLLLCCLSVAPVRSARADGKSCGDAFVSGQKKLKAGSLIAAREQFSMCAADSCSSNVRNECTRFLDEVRTRIPSVVLEAHAGAKSLVDVVVTVDGRPLASKLDGKAIDIDPGPHTFSFTSNGDSRSVAFVVVEGKRSQDVVATFDPPKAVEAPAPTATATPAPTPAAPPTSTAVASDTGTGSTTRRTIGLVAVGAGVVLGGVGAVLALKGSSDYKNPPLDAGICGSGCDQAQADARSKTHVGAAILGIGAAVIVGGAIVWLTAPSASSASTPRVGLTSNGIILRGAF